MDTSLYGQCGDVPLDRIRVIAFMPEQGYVLNRVWTCPRQGKVARLSSLEVVYAVLSNPRGETFACR